MIVPDRGPGVHTPAPPFRARTAPPVWLPVVPDAIPRELTDAVAWYPAIIRPKAGKVGTWDKIPGDPKTGKPAKWSDPTTRCTFSTAFMAYESHPEWFSGIGYMMHTESGLIGVDVDKCVSPDGTIAPWALEIVTQFNGAYWERSISGTGLRGFCKGTLPVGGCRSKIEGCSVELYADERFLVVTGQAVRP
jgi:primase-polymerase (primpol)-like protein